MEPSIKGSLMLGVVVTVRRMRDRGRISAPELAARLSGPALELIDQKIDIGRWYPIQIFSELLELDWEVGGNREPDYMRREGEQAANRLFDSQIYQQLQYAERSARIETTDALLRQSKLITTITGSLYSFLQFEVRLAQDGRQLEVLYRNAALFSEALRYTTEGFMSQINGRQGSSRRWTSERVRRDLVIFRMPLPGRLAGGS